MESTKVLRPPSTPSDKPRIVLNLNMHGGRRALVSRCRPIATSLDIKSLPVAEGGYQGKPFKEATSLKQPYDLADLEANHFKYIPWDGKTPRPILDINRRVCAVLAGQPDDKDYEIKCRGVYEAMTSAVSSVVFDDKDKHHVRGDYPVLNVGLTPGQGSTHPINVDLGKYERVVEELLKNDFIQAIARYQNDSFNTWNPKVYARYHMRLRLLFGHRKYGVELRRITSGVYPSAAFNFGPQAWTNRHRDPKNVSYGWCAITTTGDFDPTKGGHLVLEGLKLVIEFPPGATILIPSATFIHGNVPVSVVEKRASFTQYCPAGLLRFVDNGFVTLADLRRKSKRRYLEIIANRKSHWEEGISLYSTLEELMTMNCHK
ncbi:hypothetical protein NP233_g12576 [Leucocoprinus birnbaumii]|uniref:Uncharacterized protein n=1 Tax=Leucocoprinus birnbaumii TaxID=56174 RepID=A0AAD5VED9_9AGAR|nr:hypothetical protein NP233_g12576 [Leucocoprinus birnbaumii]